MTTLPPENAREFRATRSAVRAILTERLRERSSGQLDRAGRVPNIEDVLLGSVPPEARAAALADVDAGDGGELRRPRDPTLFPRFNSYRSSCALAVNAFAPWRIDPTTLVVEGVNQFTQLGFEVKLPIEGVGRRPPNLDVVIEGSPTVAIESKFIEYLDRSKPAEFAASYDSAVARLAHPTWQAAYSALKEEPRRYQFFGAAQVLKHYLGIKSNYAGRPVRLLYLFWEPEDHERHQLFVVHQDEARKFAATVDDPDVAFGFLTYGRLWDEWARLPEPSWVHDHVAGLRKWYEVSLS